MHFIYALISLAPCIVSAARVSHRADPVLFTYKFGQNDQKCSSIKFPGEFDSFHASQLGPTGCVVLEDFFGNSDPISSAFILETPNGGECQGMYMQVFYFA